jgi:hypothetical protein
MLPFSTRRQNLQASLWLTIILAIAPHARGDEIVAPLSTTKVQVPSEETLGALSPDFQTVASTEFVP